EFSRFSFKTRVNMELEEKIESPSQKAIVLWPIAPYIDEYVAHRLRNIHHIAEIYQKLTEISKTNGWD
ncbi:hypothetical protein CEXT_458811, partial [Caerostris extrusa]